MKHDPEAFKKDLADVCKKYGITEAVILFQVDHPILTGVLQFSAHNPPNPIYTDFKKQLDEQCKKAYKEQCN